MSNKLSRQARLNWNNAAILVTLFFGVVFTLLGATEWSFVYEYCAGNHALVTVYFVLAGLFVLAAGAACAYRPHITAKTPKPFNKSKFALYSILIALGITVGLVLLAILIECCMTAVIIIGMIPCVGKLILG